MIRHIWDEVIASDRALSQDEWAGVRLSTSAERKAVQAGRKEVCNTFLFQGCGHILRLIVTDDHPQPGAFRRMSMERSVRAAIEKRRPSVERAFSSAIYAVAMALTPGAIVDLQRAQGSMRCKNCDCIFAVGGPVEPDSTQSAWARGEVLSSKFTQRSASR